MKKLNNKGFAISTILYGIMILFLMLLLAMLGILNSYKNNLSKLLENSRDIVMLTCVTEDSTIKIVEDTYTNSCKNSNTYNQYYDKACPSPYETTSNTCKKKIDYGTCSFRNGGGTCNKYLKCIGAAIPNDELETFDCKETTKYSGERTCTKYTCSKGTLNSSSNKCELTNQTSCTGVWTKKE